MDPHPISQLFGESLPELAAAYAEYGGHHNGVDIARPIGTPVHASAAGLVLLAGVNPARPARGLHLIVQHEDGYETYYLHLSALWVSAGTQVAQGDVIAQSGDSGGVAAHLHWGLRAVARFEELPMRGYEDPTLFVLE